MAQRFPLAALTNGNADVQRVGLGAFFQCAVSAHEHGIAKPVVYEAYRVHCEAEGRHAMSANRFGPVLRAMDGVVEKRHWAASGKNVRVWVLPRKVATRPNESWSDVA